MEFCIKKCYTSRPNIIGSTGIQLFDKDVWEWVKDDWMVSVSATINNHTYSHHSFCKEKEIEDTKISVSKYFEEWVIPPYLKKLLTSN